MDEETFGEKMPYVSSINNVGIQFTGTFEIFPINPTFKEKYELETSAIFVLRGYKKQLGMYKKLPSTQVPRAFYRNVTQV
jgi:hypothetical protein